MTIERSHGRARPTLPRSSDLQLVGAVGERLRNHGAGGRFVTGNDAGRGRGWRSLIRKSLDPSAETEVVVRLARESWTLHLALLRELPSTGAQVSTMTAARARWTTLAAFYSNRAAEVGLDTPEGKALLDLAVKLDQRAERLAVTALDIATRLAKARPPSAGGVPWYGLPAKFIETPAPEEEDDEEEEEATDA